MYGGSVFTHVESSESVNRMLSSALRNISGVNGYTDTWCSTISAMTDNTNISIVDIGVIENMPMEAPEPWTTTMYICLFVGGFWCGARTFLMILIVHMYWEQLGVQRYWGAITPIMPFWAEWQSSMASQSTRGSGENPHLRMTPVEASHHQKSHSMRRYRYRRKRWNTQR